MAPPPESSSREARVARSSQPRSRWELRRTALPLEGSARKARVARNSRLRPGWRQRRRQGPEYHGRHGKGCTPAGGFRRATGPRLHSHPRTTRTRQVGRTSSLEALSAKEVPAGPAVENPLETRSTWERPVSCNCERKRGRRRPETATGRSVARGDCERKRDRRRPEAATGRSLASPRTTVETNCHGGGERERGGSYRPRWSWCF